MSENTRIVETGCDDLACEIVKRVAVVTLDRPEARNAITMEMKKALVEFKAAGFEKILHLEGGYRKWVQTGNDVVK